MLIDSKFRSDNAAQDARAVSELLAGSNAAAVTFYPENAIIYAQGDEAGPLYLVEFGVVRVCRLTADGRRQVHAFHFAGEVFGFEAGGEHEFYAESVNGAGVRSLRPLANAALAPNLLAVALTSLVRAQQHQLVLGRRSATEKLAGFILDMAERQDADSLVVLPMQRNDVADYLGLTFETVSRALRALKDAGVIRVPTVHQIEVLNPAALEELAA
jgi:CRP/FNR family nitrogen fixation transcriptional regulator